MHKMETLELTSPVPAAKGAQLMAVGMRRDDASDEKKQRFMLCTCKKKKLTLFEMHRNGQYKSFREVELPEPPITLEWCNENVVVGFKREYKLVTS